MANTIKFSKCVLAMSVGLSAAQMILAETNDPSLQQVVTPVDVSHGDDTVKNQQVAPEKSAEGFIDGSKLTLISRNYYFSRDYRNVPSTDQSFQEEWAQGEILEYQSGYTKGVIGFGIDAYGYAGFKLDSGKGRTSQGGSIVGLLPVNSQGDPEDSYGESGAALKMRMSETELKYGEMRTAAPVFATGDAFLLPETATGFLATSSDIENLALEAGHFTRFNDYNSTNSDGDVRPSYGSGKPGNAISFAGATYTVSDDATLMLYGSHYEDNWNQYFVNANYGIPFSEEQKLVFDLNVYRSLSTGSANQGSINNTSSSLKASYIVGIHTIDLAQQHIHGDTPFDYIGWDSIWLANSNQYSDFNAPGENSTSLAYTIDLADLIAPGLTVMAKYTKGTDIDGTDADPTGGYVGYYGNNGEHWERDFDVKYLVPSGTFKDLSIRLRQATHRGNTDQGDGAIDELRLSFTYPWELF